MYIDIGITFSDPNIFIVIGIRAAIINRIACLENKPEFLIAYFSK